MLAGIGMKRPSPPDVMHHRDVDKHADDDDDGWQTVLNGRPSKKLKKMPKQQSSNFPLFD